MNTKIKLVILALTVSILLILSVYATRATGSIRLDTPTSDLAAPKPLILTDEQGEYPLGLHMDILEDPSGELTIEDVSSPSFDSQFTPSQVEAPIYGYTDSVYWVRMNLDNQTRQTDKWLLEMDFSNTQYVDLYTPLPNGEGFTVKQTGVLRPPCHTGYPLSTNHFQPDHSNSKPADILPALLRRRIDDLADSPCGQWMLSRYIQPRSHAALVVFYGGLLALLVYHLFLLFIFSRGESTFILFSSLQVCLLLCSELNGYLGVYLFPSMYLIKAIYFPLLLPLYMFRSRVILPMNFWN